jgi:hypothetical protein
MNQFLPSRFVENVERLALGIEPMDAVRARPLSYQLQVEYEAALSGLPRPPIERHTSNRYALRLSTRREDADRAEVFRYSKPHLQARTRSTTGWPWMTNNPGDLTGDVAPRKEVKDDPNSAYRQDKRIWGDPIQRGKSPGSMSPVAGSTGLSPGNTPQDTPPEIKDLLGC